MAHIFMKYVFMSYVSENPWENKKIWQIKYQLDFKQFAT